MDRVWVLLYTKIIADGGTENYEPTQDSIRHHHASAKAQARCWPTQPVSRRPPYCRQRQHSNYYRVSCLDLSVWHPTFQQWDELSKKGNQWDGLPEKANIKEIPPPPDDKVMVNVDAAIYLES